ncbi:MAG: InlB B-repeat-containing protein [Treponema sp.]|nr:InlB B-repeat-containing protein [Treponema sp.]
MGYLKFRYNDKIYIPVEDYEVYGLTSENNLCLYMNTGSGSTARKYSPGFATRGTKVLVKTTDSGKTYIDNSSPSLCFKKNGTVYYVAKSMTFVAKRTVYYNANGGTGSMDSQSFYPDDGESITIKSNAFSKSGYSFEKWNTSPDGSGTSYNAGSTYKGNGMTLYAQWKSVFSATNWAYAYSSSNVWQTTHSGKTIYHWQEHIYTISVKVTAPSTNVYDFIVVSNSGLWTGSLVSNPDIPMNGSTTKTLSVQVRFRASAFGGDPATHLVIGLRDRTNSVNTVVSRFTVNTYLSFGTTDSEE